MLGLPIQRTIVEKALHFTSATGVVFGLALAAISQGLGSLRLIAHNSENLEASQ